MSSLLDGLQLTSPATIGGILAGVAAIYIIGRLFLSESKPEQKKDKGKEKQKDDEPEEEEDTKATTKSKGVLNPSAFQAFALMEKKDINHNTRLFRFALPTKDSVLGLPIGQHMSFRAVIDDKEVYRPYTPTSSDDDLGYFDLIVKVYPQGKMSQYMDKLKIGDKIDVKGPKGSFIYKPNMKRAFGMIAGGTGITPMLQVIQAVLKNPEDKTQLSLIFANVKEEDILVRELLESLAEKHPDRFKLFYTLNEAPEGWKYGTGFVSQQMIRDHCPAPADDIMIVMCGPAPMNNAMVSHLEAIGYSESMYFKF